MCGGGGLLVGLPGDRCGSDEGGGVKRGGERGGPSHQKEPCLFQLTTVG